MSHTTVVVNPNSQNGALGRRWPEVARALRRALDGFDTLFTESPGDATALTREALSAGSERIVAVGGDGTLSEVVNGFFHAGEAISPDATLGVIPFGTGGDFRRTVGLPTDLSSAAQVIADGATRRIDVGLLEYRQHDGEAGSQVFVNIASFGISGVVDRLVNESSKRLGGRLSFMLGSLRATWQYSNQRVQLWFDDDRDDAIDMTINTVAIANGCYFGGGMNMAPDAELDDGFFDVVAIGDISRREAIMSAPRLYRGTHLSLDKVSHRRARTVHAVPLGREPVELDVDGETPGILPASMRVLPQALSLLVPG